jgi:hypothetical protein
MVWFKIMMTAFTITSHTLSITCEAVSQRCIKIVIVVVIHRRVSWGWSWWWGMSLQYVHACNKFSNSLIKLLIGCRRRVLVFFKSFSHRVHHLLQFQLRDTLIVVKRKPLVLVHLILWCCHY